MKEIELNETELTLAVGETFQLTAAIKPSYANNKNVVWSSKNEQVATVNETGLVTAIAGGGAPESLPVQRMEEQSLSAT